MYEAGNKSCKLWIQFTRITLQVIPRANFSLGGQGLGVSGWGGGGGGGDGVVYPSHKYNRDNEHKGKIITLY